MNLFDLITSVTGGQDPAKAMLAAVNPLGGAAQPSPQAAAPAPNSNVPEGVKTPVTAPQPVSEVPKVIQSPPDLANLYIQLMRSNQNARALDSGLATIASAFSIYPENRAALLQTARERTSGASGVPNIDDFTKLNKLSVENQTRAVRQAAKVGLMKRYGLDTATVDYLDASGSLDDVIKHKNSQNLTVVEAPDGSKAFYDPVTGTKVTDIAAGAAKPRETHVVKDETTGKQTLVYKDTGEPVRELAPARKPGDKVSEEQDTLFRINEERKAKGLQPLSEEEFARQYGKKGVTVNVGPTGTPFPEPEKGYAYTRNPDGSVKVGDDGKPEVYALPGSKAEQDRTKTGLEIKKDERVEKEAAEAELGRARQKYAAVSTTINAVDQAKKTITEAPWYAPAVGFGAGIPAMVGGTPATNLKPFLKEINANTAFQQLQAMRDSSKTGAALGPVSDFENKLLSAAIGDLDPSQSQDQIINQLNRIKATMVVLAENKFNSVESFTAARDKLVSEYAGTVSGKGGSKIEMIRPPTRQ